MKPGIYNKLEFQANRRALSRNTKFVLDQASGGVSRIIPVRVIDQFETEKATVGFVHSDAYGHMLLIDSEIQLAELDEHIYHESLVHAGLAAISARSSSALDVLVLGGGDGCALREIFKWSNIRQVTLVDHDPRIRLFFRKPHVNKVFGSSAALGDNRVNYQAFDARQFLKVSEAVWDLVIVDLPDFESSVADLLEIMLTRRTKRVE